MQQIRFEDNNWLQVVADLIYVVKATISKAMTLKFNCTQLQ